MATNESKEEINTLRKLAMAAKRRLNGASEEQRLMQKQKKETIKVKSSTPFDLYKNLYKSEYQIRVLDDKEDEELYVKICEMLDADYDTPTPIGQLVDKELFELLNAEEKQRYIFILVDKYCLLKERYFNEHLRKA